MTEMLGARKVFSTSETISEEAGLSVTPLTKIAVAAVMKNPWLTEAPGSDLTPTLGRVNPGLAMLLTDYLLELVPEPDAIHGYGKAAAVGVDGELEHAAAMIHNAYFGPIMRKRLRGTAYVSFADLRTLPGRMLTVPTGHKTKSGTRSYFQTVNLPLPDSPEPDELVVAIAAVTGQRPLARIGDRTTDSTFDLEQYAATIGRTAELAHGS